MKKYSPLLRLMLLLSAMATVLSITLTDCRSPRRALSRKSQPRRTGPDRQLIAQGERIVQMTCAHCHGNSDGRLAGQPMTGVSKALGRIVSANITNDSVQGIGGWPDAELIRALRTGIDPEGHKIHFIMPRYPLLADADMQAVVAFLRSDAYAVQATPYTGPAHKPSFLSAFIATFFIKRLPEPTQPIPLPDTTKSVRYGRYLVNSRYQCFACHSADVEKADLLHPEQTKGYLAGGAKLTDGDGKPIYSANLTPDPKTGFGRYTQTEFAEVMRLGKKRNGQIVRSPMMPYPLLTNREITAIYEYLKSVPAVHHVIEK